MRVLPSQLERPVGADESSPSSFAPSLFASLLLREGVESFRNGGMHVFCLHQNTLH